MSLSPELPFKIEVPVEFFEKAGAKGKERRIRGIISTEHRDKQGEIVLQRGLEFDDFLTNGWFNDNHSKDTAGVLGYPETISPTLHKGKKATAVEGYLLAGQEGKTIDADKIWDLGKALQETDRKLGFSIEGKVLRRVGENGKTIAKARVTNVAITNCPVNIETGMDVLVKSMMALEGNQEAIDTLKALTAGAAITAPATAEPGDGYALRTESMVTGPGSAPKKKKKKRKRTLSKAEAIEVIHDRYPTLSDAQAEKVWQWAKTRSSR